MKRSILVLAMVSAVTGPALVLAQGEMTPETRRALEQFVGLWQMTPIAALGSTGEARYVRFHSDWTYTTYAEDGAELWSGTFSLDPAVSPKIWDHRDYEKLAKDPHADILGVYEQIGDMIRVSVTVGRWDEDEWVGLPRATHVEPSAGYSVIEFRRADDGLD